MAEIDITVNGRNYRIACEDGEEEHLMQLAEHLDRHAKDLAGVVGQVGESQLMLMAGLLVGDELSDALDRVDELERTATEVQADRERNTDTVGAATQAMESAAQRIEDIAARIKSA